MCVALVLFIQLVLFLKMNMVSFSALQGHRTVNPQKIKLGCRFCSGPSVLSFQRSQRTSCVLYNACSSLSLSLPDFLYNIQLHVDAVCQPLLPPWTPTDPLTAFLLPPSCVYILPLPGPVSAITYLVLNMPHRSRVAAEYVYVCGVVCFKGGFQCWRRGRAAHLNNTVFVRWSPIKSPSDALCPCTPSPSVWTHHPIPSSIHHGHPQPPP